MMEENKEAIEMGRSWADLPAQIIPLFLEKLFEISDFLRSRTVCKTWCFSSSVSDLSPQFPWILNLSKGPNLELYSIAFNKVYTIHAHCLSGKSLIRPVDSYLLTGHEGNANTISLLNPLNNREVHLPILHDYHRDLSKVVFPWFNFSGFQIDGHMYVSKHDISLRCKPDDDKWEIIGPGHKYIYRCYYFKGSLFRVDCDTGVTIIINIIEGRQLCVIPPPKYEKMSKMYSGLPYLVESCGEILAVAYNHSYSKMDYKFYIHRLDYDNGKGNPCWVKLSSIGDRILFFDFTVVTGCGFCLRASDFPGFKGNCIYFINKYVNVINKYDIENGETVLIYTPFNWESRITWFMPTLNHM